MESHTRIQCKPNMVAVQELDGNTYRILMYLAIRSNKYGTCFPYGTTIATDLDLDTDTVYPALAQLEACGYIKTHINAFYNRFSGQSRPPLFQVSPFFLEIAEEFQNEAIEVWKNGMPKFSASNQQQESTALNNDSIQRQETTTTTNKANRDFKKESATAKSQKPKQQQRLTNSPQDDNRKNSAIVKKYTNPILINSELEDLQEHLAQKLVGIGIKIILARGFIAQYGYADCDVAYNHIEFLSKRQEIENPAGFYRYLLQGGMLDKLPSLQPKNYSGRNSEYDDFIES